jgi:hypothetical protein
LEEVTVIADSGPVMLFRDCTSLSRADASVWIWVSALIWLCRVFPSVCHACSGARAAVTAEFTAEVTSIPDEEDPVAASRIELMSMADEEEDKDESRELSDDDDVLIMTAFSAF